MKSASLICASIFVLALGTADSACAGGTLIGTAPGTTEADCTDGGGIVTVDSQGNKVCEPRPIRKGTEGREPPNHN